MEQPGLGPILLTAYSSLSQKDSKTNHTALCQLHQAASFDTLSAMFKSRFTAKKRNYCCCTCLHGPSESDLFVFSGGHYAGDHPLRVRALLAAVPDLHPLFGVQARQGAAGTWDRPGKGREGRAGQ